MRFGKFEHGREDRERRKERAWSKTSRLTNGSEGTSIKDFYHRNRRKLVFSNHFLPLSFAFFPFLLFRFLTKGGENREYRNWSSVVLFYPSLSRSLLLCWTRCCWWSTMLRPRKVPDNQDRAEVRRKMWLNLCSASTWRFVFCFLSCLHEEYLYFLCFLLCHINEIEWKVCFFFVFLIFSFFTFLLFFSRWCSPASSRKRWENEFMYCSSGNMKNRMRKRNSIFFFLSYNNERKKNKPSNEQAERQLSNEKKEFCFPIQLNFFHELIQT